MNYAIVEASGRQIWVQLGQFYDLNYINSEPGDTIYLHRVLLLKQNNQIQVGTPCVNSVKIRATILKHLKGRKIIVFKMKPKKNVRSKNGHRQKLTRILIEEVTS
uniref:50S ribosomal protein L21, chloroplastic n=1 Tax=Callithamnion tetricum TaxID=193179 RepID=A0A4D6WP85_9FLOR|nr:ribosomal protein L21 [Callithamnion tetricum]